MGKKPNVVDIDILLSGQPCSHPGCVAHQSHPCEVCGRRGMHGMTTTQRDMFLWITSCGIACGLESPIEWLQNYLFHQTQLEKYEDIPHRRQVAWIAFYNLFHDSTPEFADTSFEDFVKWVDEDWSKNRTRLSPHKIKDYLDGAIRSWRGKRDQAETTAEHHECRCYVDAFQSVRTSIFGSTLPEEVKTECKDSQ